jgi:hypothetical protein
MASGNNRTDAKVLPRGQNYCVKVQRRDARIIKFQMTAERFCPAFNSFNYFNTLANGARRGGALKGVDTIESLDLLSKVLRYD